MTIENDFIPFAAAGGANVVAQSAWAVEADVATGFGSGILPSAKLNKALRQSSIIAAVIADLIVAQTGQTAIDDGTTATLLANLITAVQNTAAANIPALQYKTANYTVVAADAKTTIAATAVAITLPSTTGLANGFPITIVSTATGTTVPTNGATVAMPTGNVTTTIALASATDFISLRWDATNTIWRLVDGSAAMLNIARAPTSFFKNLLITVASATTVTATADLVVMTNAAGTQSFTGPVSATASISSTGLNGLDTGTVAASTWYAVWAVSNGTTTGVVLSTSGSGPTLPTGYMYYARLGWVRAGSGSQLLATVQRGRRAQYVVGGPNVSGLPIIASGSAGSPGTSPSVAVTVGGAGTAGSFAPSTASQVDIVFNTTASNYTNSQVVIAANANYGSYGSSTNPPPLVYTNGSPGFVNGLAGRITLESNSIYWASSFSSGILCILGWEDNI